MKKGDYIVIGLIMFFVVLAIVFSDKIVSLFNKAKTAVGAGNSNTDTTTQTNTSTPPAPLDYNLLLTKGVNAPEVKKLQEWLGGISVDGMFGPQTENRLFERKGVKQTTLSQYQLLEDVGGVADVPPNSDSGSMIWGGGDNESWWQSAVNYIMEF